MRLERARVLANYRGYQSTDRRPNTISTERLVVFAPANQAVVGGDLQVIERATTRIRVERFDGLDFHNSPVTCFGSHISSTAGEPLRTASNPRLIAGATSSGSVTFSPYAPLAAASPA